MTDRTGGTPLHLAAITGHFKIVEMLLDTGADPNARNHQHWTPLHIATKNARPRIVRLLAARGADLEATEYRGQSALCFTVSPWQARYEAANCLLERGASVYSWGWNGTPLEKAILHRSPSMKELFLSGIQNEMANFVRHTFRSTAESGPGSGGYWEERCEVAKETFPELLDMLPECHEGMAILTEGLVTAIVSENRLISKVLIGIMGDMVNSGPEEDLFMLAKCIVGAFEGKESDEEDTEHPINAVLRIRDQIREKIGQ
jgi:Ankyrin repeats (many copies)